MTPPKKPSRKRVKHAKRHVSYHYFRLMPAARLHRIVLWGVFIVVAGIIAGQLLYPPDRALPRAELASEHVGYASYEELAEKLNQQFTATSLDIRADSRQVSATVAEVGGELQAGPMIEQLQRYPFWQRFIPFSILQVPRVNQPSVRYTAQVLDTFTRAASSKLSWQPTNAGLRIQDGTLESTPDIPGGQVSPEALRQVIISHQLVLGVSSTLSLQPQPVAPETTEADFAAVRARAERALSRQIVLSTAADETSLDQRTIASLLEIINNKSTGQPELAISSKGLAAYVRQLNKIYGRPASMTHITLVNGIETARKKGRVGSQVDAASLGRALDRELLLENPVDQITLDMQPVTPRVIYNNRYTSSQSGLAAYVHDAAEQYSANIVVRQLDGHRWSASDSGSRSTVSASTYKLYVALKLFDEMNQGRVKWGDSMLDTTVSGCFDRMTIASTNPCAEAWLSQWGRMNINQFVYDQGFSRGTTFTDQTAAHTTADDLARYMIGLEDGSLISGAQRQRLLTSLSSHPYRMGVPAGSDGQVWDKVGFLWDYVHDAAIVHHPRGRYVIVVMTKGQSYARIASITRQVEKILYP